MIKTIDPLYIIFEEKLYDNSQEYSSNEDFIFLVVREYIDFIKEKGAIIPNSLFDETIDTLFENVKTMLIKKIYGCSNITEFKKITYLGKEEDIELSKLRYKTLKKSA